MLVQAPKFGDKDIRRGILLAEYKMPHKDPEKRRAYCRAWRALNPEKARAYVRAYQARNRERVRARGRAYRHPTLTLLSAHKMSVGCFDCGRKDGPPRAYDFDHVRGEKQFDLAMARQQSRSVKEVRAEMGKCDVVCAFCHGVRTAWRNGWRPKA